MGKSQHQPDGKEYDSSSDSSQEKSDSSSPTTCKHAKKAVDTLHLRKLLKTSGILVECELCKKRKPNVIMAEVTVRCNYEDENTIWLCLRCGVQLCGRLKNEHALAHYLTPHSDSHDLALNTQSFVIWCYKCNNLVKADSTKTLLDCVEFIKSLAHKKTTTNTNGNANSNSNSNTKEHSAYKDIQQKILEIWESTCDVEDSTSTAVKSSAEEKVVIPLAPPLPPPIPGIAKRVNETSILHNAYNATPVVQINRTCETPALVSANIIDNLPRVRGLTNLGNTCFFNAVLQCLAQTPYLLEVLKESSQPGEEFTLPGGTYKFAQDEVILPPIKGTLSAWGSLTNALAQTLEELQSGGGVFTPSKLFNKLCSKCQQFEGGDQHDSHELLRHLLESVRSEDLKRYQRVILQNLGYKDQDVNLVSDDMKQKCKIYGIQAADRILRPDQVFRGFLVSTLTCQVCYNVSSRHEYFLDLSLPVSVEKPQPPQMRHKLSPENSNLNSFYLHNVSSTTSAPAVLTKAQLKKERKMKRAAKHQNTKLMQKQKYDELLSGADGDGIEASTELESVSPNDSMENNCPASSESGSTEGESDADIEDNLIDESEKTDKPLTVAISKAVHTSTHDTNGNLLVNSFDDRDNHMSSNNIMDKDSLDEDENDSGIATSPAIPINSLPQSSNSNSEECGEKTLSEEAKVTNSILSLGLSEKGVTVVKKLSLCEGTEDTNGVEDANAGCDESDDTITQTTTQLLDQLRINKNITMEWQQAQIQLQEKTQAQRGKTKRVRTQSYSDWSTTIAPRYQCEDGECSIQSCLNNFTAVELMTGNNKVGCDNCTRQLNGDNPNAKTVNTNATKQFLISSPPAVLILHLKRFQLGPRCIFRKLTRHVNFNTLLDVAPFCGSKVKNLPNIDRKQKKLLYALYGVVEHSGGMYGGHYTAYVKVRSKLDANDKRWKFIPQGSKAELDQDDEQRKKLEELLAREKARELRIKANDSDDLSNSSMNTDSTNTSTSTSEPEDVTIIDQQQGAVGGIEEASNVQMPLGKWYHVSDSYVREVTESTVLSAQAYLLFYERIY